MRVHDDGGNPRQPPLVADLVARAAPGTSTRFVAISLDEALEARRELAEREQNARAALGVSS
ncbi:hypothetical protein ACOM2C_10365 [Pseudarthrobacter sp. So.54]